jgi:hypothetical protein
MSFAFVSNKMTRSILTLQPKILLIIEGTEETNFVFARESPCFNEYHHLIVCILKRRLKIRKISVRMVANRSRVWKVMTSLMMNFDLQVRLLTCMGVVGRSKLSSCIGECNQKYYS